MSEQEFTKSIDALIRRLKMDEPYYYSWKANLAIAFIDQYKQDYVQSDYSNIEETALNAADRFLTLFIMSYTDKD